MKITNCFFFPKTLGQRLVIIEISIYIYFLFFFQITEVVLVDDDSPVKYSVETVLYPDKYEIV